MITIKNCFQYRKDLIAKFAIYSENKDSIIKDILYKLETNINDKELFMDIIYDNIHYIMLSGVFTNFDFTYIADYKNGYAVVCKTITNTYLNNKYDLFGFIDKRGEIVIEPQFEFAYSFKENGLSIVKKEGKYGFIKSDGKYLIEPKFDDLKPFSGNQTEAKLDGVWKNINKKGEII